MRPPCLLVHKYQFYCHDLTTTKEKSKPVLTMMTITMAYKLKTA